MPWGSSSGAASVRQTERIAGWLMGALLLHLGALAGLAVWIRTDAARSAGESSSARPHELPVALEWGEPARQQPARTVPDRVEMDHAASRSARRPPSANSLRPGVAPTPTAPAAPSEPESITHAETPAGPARALSLAQLGIGTGASPYLLDELAPLTQAEQIAQRLDASLAASLALGDSARGLGMEGPALRAVTDLAINSALPLTTSARLLLVVNGSGVTQSVSLLEVGADRAEWQRIADDLRRKLATQRLRIPASSAGARLQLVVSSRPLTASGAQPGLDAELFGTAKRTRAATVGRLSVLPRQAEAKYAQFPRLEGSHHMSGFSNNLSSGHVDVADLAGGQQRSVRAQLARLDLVGAGEQLEAEHVSP